MLIGVRKNSLLGGGHYDADDFIRLFDEKYSSSDCSWDISEFLLNDFNLEVETKSLILSSHILREFEDLE